MRMTVRSIRRLLHHQTYRDRHGNRQESRTWYITIKGKHHPLGEDLAAAETRARELLSHTAHHRTTADPRVEDLLQLVEDDYRANRRPALDHLKSRAEHLRAFFGNPRAASIHTGTLRAYQAQRLHAGVAPATINVELALLQRGFSLARQDGSLDAGPTFPRLTENNARKGFFEREEMEKISAFSPEHLGNFVRVAYFTGWRKMELLTRQWRHVDFSAGWLRLDRGETKNGEGREFPLIPDLKEALQLQRVYVDALQADYGRVIPWVFPNDKGHPMTHIWHEWDAARKRAGLPCKLIHDFRRTAVRNLEQAGVPRSAAMAMVGHKTQAMYSRYAIADRGLLEAAGQKLDNFHAGARHEAVKVVSIGGGSTSDEK